MLDSDHHAKSICMAASQNQTGLVIAHKNPYVFQGFCAGWPFLATQVSLDLFLNILDVVPDGYNHQT